jgi:hypothetical protein
VNQQDSSEGLKITPIFQMNAMKPFISTMATFSQFLVEEFSDSWKLSHELF